MLSEANAREIFNSGTKYDIGGVVSNKYSARTAKTMSGLEPGHIDVRGGMIFLKCKHVDSRSIAAKTLVYVAWVV